MNRPAQHEDNILLFKFVGLTLVLYLAGSLLLGGLIVALNR